VGVGVDVAVGVAVGLAAAAGVGVVVAVAVAVGGVSPLPPQAVEAVRAARTASPRRSAVARTRRGEVIDYYVIAAAPCRARPLASVCPPVGKYNGSRPGREARQSGGRARTMDTKLRFHLPAGRFHVCETMMGWIGLVFSSKGLRGTTTPRRRRDEALRDLAETGVLGLATEAEAGELPRRLRDFAEGRPADLSGDIDWEGLCADGRSMSEFRRAVLEETMRIPAGETRTYGWLAQKVGQPRAARAVGRVMATNPLPVVVPCHRVVGSDGSLHGYGGGLEVKDALLRLEGARGQASTRSHCPRGR
jgi:methylated-DNA-[protein]-cysteine S-methyltransferase